MAKRLQFHLDAKQGDNLFRDLSQIENSHWPKLKAGKRASTNWTRIALRCLWAHQDRAQGHEWFVVQGEQRGEPLRVDVPSADETHTLSNKIDITLSETDLDRIAKLSRKLGVTSRPSLLRISLRLLADIGKQLKRTGDLRTGSDSDPELERVDLKAFMSDATLAPSKIEFKVRGRTLAHGSNPPAPPLSDHHPKAPEYGDAGANELWVLIAYVTTLNKALAVEAANITRRATREQGDRQALQRENDLLKLCNRFALLEKRSETQHLANELKDHLLLPSRWRNEASMEPFRDVIDAAGAFGARVVREFLEARLARLRPIQHTALSPQTGDAPSEPTTHWRNWTKSSDVGGYREIFAPLEWVDVLHHYLCSSRPGGDPAMVAHDLQVWLNETYDIKNRRHFPTLVETCRRFNGRVYGNPALSGGRAAEETHELLRIGEFMETLRSATPPATSAVSLPEEHWFDEQREQWAQVMYMYLVISRTVRAVYRWKITPNSDAAAARVTSKRGRGVRPAAPTRAREEIVFKNIQPWICSLGYADLATLRATLFGAQTAISGLHWILRGGIVPRLDRGHTWLISGKSGTGKSTLGLALAADLSRRGHCALVVLSEERAQTIEERLVMLGLRDDSRYRVVTRAEFMHMLDDEESEPRGNAPESKRVSGLLVLCDATSREDDGRGLSSWLTDVSEKCRRNARRIASKIRADRQDVQRTAKLRGLYRRWLWTAVVVDSVDALEIEVPGFLSAGTANRNDRTGMSELVQTLEANRCWGIVVSGDEGPRKAALTQYADTVIQLGTDESGIQRALAITKCRIQPYDPGQHVLQLADGVGVLLYPNLSATQRMLRRRARRHLDSEHVIVVPERIHWKGAQPVARVAKATAKPKPKGWPEIRRGSTVLLYGEGQSGKGPFWLNLVAERMQLSEFPNWPLGATGAVHIVSVRSDEQESMRPLREARALVDAWRDNISDVQFKWYAADSTMTAAQVTSELVNRIRRSRRDSLPIEWIVFLGVEALDNNLPTVAAEKIFWPTILATTASEEITTLFVASEPEADFVSEHKQDMDYVFRFSRTHGTRRVYTEKSLEPPPANGYPILELDLHDGVLRVSAR